MHRRFHFEKVFFWGPVSGIIFLRPPWGDADSPHGGSSALSINAACVVVLTLMGLGVGCIETKTC